MQTRIVALLALAIAGSAQAQTSTELTRDNWPAEVLKRPLTLAQGLAQLSLPLTANLSNNAVGNPVYVPALLAYGVTDGFTLALTHGTGLCLSGTSNGCPKVYNDVGVQGLFALAPRGGVQLAGVLGFQAVSLSDPSATAAVVGFDSRYSTGGAALRIDPRLAIGLSGRDAAVGTAPVPVALDFHGAPVVGGNRETLFVPVALQFQPAVNLALTVASGFAAQLDPLVGSFSDSLSIPLGLSAAITSSHLDLGASFGFDNLKPPGNLSATDLRSGQVFLSLRN